MCAAVGERRALEEHPPRRADRSAHPLHVEAARPADADERVLEAGNELHGGDDPAERDRAREGGAERHLLPHRRPFPDQHREHQARPGVDDVDRRLGIAREPAHAGREGENGGAATPPPRREVADRQTSQGQPCERLEVVGRKECERHPPAHGEEQRRDQGGGPPEPEAPCKRGGRDADERHVQPLRHGERARRREEHVEDVCGIEESDLQRADPRDPAELV